MANRKPRHTHADAQRIHTHTEIDRRLFRAERLVRCMYFEAISDSSPAAELCMSSVLSYLADDLRDLRKLTEKSRQ
ncbi:derepression protein [Salmonella enterica]|nr:derepression protein [Salmonella enterica]EEB4926594.1 derepression protein [Salmonella enterica subsp. enterica serovar Brandenburg]